MATNEAAATTPPPQGSPTSNGPAPQTTPHTVSGSAGNMNLFVANLSSDVTDEVLHKSFEPFGNILTCKVMLDIHTGISRGFGFVLFENAEDGARAMAQLHGTQIGQKQIYVSVAMTNGLSGLQQTPKIYVRNVPKALTLDFLRAHFNQFGEIVRINFREDQTQVSAPQEHRAYLATTTILFLEYKTAAQAETAVKATHNSRPWPHISMDVPLLAKPAETSQMRNERRQRQNAKAKGTGSAGHSTSSQPKGSASSFGISGSQSGSVPGLSLDSASPMHMMQFSGSTGQTVAGAMLPTPVASMPMNTGLPMQPSSNVTPQPIFYVPVTGGMTMMPQTAMWPQPIIMIPQGGPMMMQMPTNIPGMGMPSPDSYR